MEEKQFLALARKRFEACVADERPLRDEAEKNLSFVAGDQWDTQVRADRTRDGRPSLTFSRCHTFVQQVANEARQNKPQMKYIPAEDSDKDTAEIYEGLARNIQYSSDAQVAYETAVEYSAGGSFGYFRFTTDYVDDESDDLELKVVTVHDPFSIYGILYPALFGLEPRFAFVTENIPLEEFKLLYPDAKITSEFESSQKEYGDWIGTETVRIAEYWYMEESEPKGKRSKSVVKYAKITGAEILEGTETTWPGSSIPIIPVLGKQLIVRGKPRLFSVISFQRDPQQLINFYKTRIAETLATAPVSPWMAVVGQIPKEPAMREAWIRAASKTVGVLEYNAIDVDGHPAPAPQRQVFEPPIGALSNAAAQEIDDMKATAGIYDPSLGNKSNEASGLAIERRQQQAGITNLHFMDNLERAFKTAGTVTAEVIPAIYDTKRMIRILGEDEAPKIVRINELHSGPDGKPRHYKVGGDGVGKYDVVVTMGRSFSTKRMESFDMMTQVLQANPNLLPMIGDIFFANSDMAGAQQLAERFKKMLPPQLQEQKDGHEIPPQVQAQMSALSQQHQLLTEQLNKATEELKTKAVEQQTKLQIAKLEMETKIAVAEIQTKAQQQNLRAQLTNQIWTELHGASHEAAMQSTQQTHDAGMAEQAQQAQLQQPEPVTA